MHILTFSSVTNIRRALIVTVVRLFANSTAFGRVFRHNGSERGGSVSFHVPTTEHAGRSAANLHQRHWWPVDPRTRKRPTRATVTTVRNTHTHTHVCALRALVHSDSRYSSILFFGSSAQTQRSISRAYGAVGSEIIWCKFLFGRKRQNVIIFIFTQMRISHWALYAAA